MENKHKKINVGGLFFDNVTLDEALLLIEEKLEKNKTKKTELVALANQDIINQVRKVAGLTTDKINKNSFLILPDGFSIVLASRLLGTSLKERVAGPDLMESLLAFSNKKGYKSFFLGAKENVSYALCERVKKRFPKLKISGRYSPPFGNFSKKENDKMIAMINRSKADFLWVSFGCPKQEKWILDNIEKIKVPLSFGIGAAFDFLSGSLLRAPKVIRKLKLEWLYRLMQEPKRLWKRYFYGGLGFLFIILKQKFFR